MKICQNCHEFLQLCYDFEIWHPYPWSSQKEPFPNWGKFTNQKDIVCLKNMQNNNFFCTLIMDIDFFVGKKF